MDKSKGKACGIIILVIICCIIMALVEIVIEPAYFVKSAVKAVVFLALPLLYGRVRGLRLFDGAFALDRKRVLRLLALGLLIYGVIFGSFVLTRNIFDYSALVDSLSADQKVENNSFLWVASYISFCNSFLEEFLFRRIAFLQLSKHAVQKTAYGFSSVAFAVYHVAMIGSSFPLPLLLISLLGLAIGGCIFDYLDEKDGSIYPSWIIHMFADLAIMTIWYLHI